MKTTTLAALTAVGLSAPALAQCDSQKVAASNPMNFHRFGHDCALDETGDTAVIGTSGGDVAYVFRRLGAVWLQAAALTASDGEPGDDLGFSVDVSRDGGRVLLGAYRDDDNGADAGAAYVFRRTGTVWTEEAKLVPSDGTAGDWLAWRESVAIDGDGDTVVLGAQNHGPSGAAWVFARTGTTWSEQAKLEVGHPNQFHSFGASAAVSADGDRIAVGASIADATVYVFTRLGSVWSFEAALQPNGGTAGAHSIAFDATASMLVTGNWLDKVPGAHQGSITIFRRNGVAWSLDEKINSPDLTSNHVFGFRVDVSSDGHRVLASDWGSYAAAQGVEGTVYLLEDGTGSFTVTERIAAPVAPFFFSEFGYGAALDGDGSTLLVGSWRDNSFGNGAGSAFFFDRPATAAYCTSKTNSLGCVPQVAHAGLASATSPDPFTLGATEVLNQKNGLLFYGLAGPTAVPFLGGTLCVVPPLRRLPLQSSGSSLPPTSDCSGAYAFEFNALIQSGQDPQLAPGQGVHAQWWSRDPQHSDGTGASLSNAVAFGICP